MANYLTPTNLLSAIAMVNGKYQSGEWRMPDSAALSTAHTGEKTIPSLADLRKREDRATYFDFPIRKSQGNATTRTALHTGDATDSLRTQLAWKQVVDTFSISMKQLDNNTSSFEDAFAKGIKSCIFNNLKVSDDWYVAQLLANKTQINVGGIRGEWDEDNYNMKLQSDQKEYWKEQIEANLANNEYMSEMTIIADSLAYSDMVRSLNQGSQNSTNLSYQFGSGQIIKTSKSILSGFDGSAIAYPSELAGLFFWIPKQNRDPLDMDKAMGSEVGSFGNIPIPVVNDKGAVMYTIDAAISMYAKRTNTSQRNGNLQDVLYQVEVSWDMGFMAAPLSDFRAVDDFAGKTDSVIHTFGLDSGGAQ